MKTIQTLLHAKNGREMGTGWVLDSSSGLFVTARERGAADYARGVEDRSAWSLEELAEARGDSSGFLCVKDDYDYDQAVDCLGGEACGG